MLALKLALVPAFLAALTFAGRVWRPSVAGWLAGLPVASFAAFFVIVMALLPLAGVLLTFACAALVSIVVQGATRRLIGNRRAPHNVAGQVAERAETA
jgi:hypothetical protein